MATLSKTQAKVEDDIPAERPPSPPPHTTFSARGIHAPTFSSFQPKSMVFKSLPNAMMHVAWNSDGRRLAAVGADKALRIWSPEKSMESRQCTTYSGHADDPDHVSWNPTHPELLCTSGQRDRRIVFWDARQSRSIQQISCKQAPTMTAYAPDGQSIAWVAITNTVHFLRFDKQAADSKIPWTPWDTGRTIFGSHVSFFNSGEGVALCHNNEHTLRIMDYPGLSSLEGTPAHVGGCTAAAVDSRGRYLATGGHDSIVNLFEINEWICARTVTACDNAVTALSFSHDGEYLAISSSGSYIEICATETAHSVHRLPALSSSLTVAWHPSKYIIAYCGLSREQARENAPVIVQAYVSAFGPGLS